LKSGWIELSLAVLDGEASEAVSELFDRYGQGGAVIELLNSANVPDNGDEGPLIGARATVKTYLYPEDGEGLRRLEEALWHLRQLYLMPEPQIRFLDYADWAEAWKESYQVLHVGRRLVIRPSWRDYMPQPNEAVLTLDPGMAFGTGLHPSTRLCLIALEKWLSPGDSLLDVGTGSGILAIAAARLGARAVLAFDIDPVAVLVARENVLLNDVADIVEVRQGTLPEAEATGFNLAVVNILAETIAGLAPDLARCLAPGGLLIASGIIVEREPLVTQALSAESFTIVERQQEGDWIALTAGLHSGDRHF
jgi:ribosomal protein L11 methyltransferase